MDCTPNKFVGGKELGGGMLFGGAAQFQHFSGSVSQ